MAKSAPKRQSASQAIRDYCREFPNKPPRDVATEMVARGFTKVTAGYVSTIKSLAKKKEDDGDTVSEGAASSGANSGGAKETGANKGGAKRGRKPRVATTAKESTSKPAKTPKPGVGGSGNISLEDLIKAKVFVDKLGGIRKASEALEAVAKLGG